MDNKGEFRGAVEDKEELILGMTVGRMSGEVRADDAQLHRLALGEIGVGKPVLGACRRLLDLGRIEGIDAVLDRVAGGGGRIGG
jgi:hypothetical protein